MVNVDIKKEPIVRFKDLSTLEDAVDGAGGGHEEHWRGSTGHL